VVVLIVAVLAFATHRFTCLLNSNYHERVSDRYIEDATRIKVQQIDPVFYTIESEALQELINRKNSQLREANRHHRLAKQYLGAALFPIPVREENLFPWLPVEPDPPESK
jgi:hypothetical protein